MKYYELVKTYQATFCSYTIFPQYDDFVHSFTLRDPKGKQLTDRINMVIIELSKLNDALKKPVESMTSFEMWSLFLRFASDPLYRKLITDIIKVKEEIGMAKELLQKISKDEHERAIYRSRRMAETDRVSDLLTAEARGEMKGEARGRAEIIALLEKGVSLEEIKRIISEEKVKKKR